MKRTISLFLACMMLFCTLSITLTANAASKPEITAAVVTIDRFHKKTVCVVKWEAQSGADGYQIKLGDGPYDGKYNYVAQKVNNIDSTSLKMVCEYGVNSPFSVAKIRTYKTKNDKTVYGEWSKLKKIRTRVIYQVEGFKGEIADTRKDSVKLKLTWNNINGADGYQIVYNQWDDAKEVKKVNVKDTSYTAWMGKVGLVRIRWYKIIDGKKIYSDYSDRFLDYTPSEK